MPLFGGFKTGPIIKNPFEKGPSITEKVNMLFTDVETEGKKQGYKRAAREYEKVFREIENEYNETKELFEAQKNNYGNQSDKLITKLSELEKLKKSLEQQLEQQTRNVSTKYDIPVGEVRSAAALGSLFNLTPSISILDLIYSHKEKKLKRAEQTGYLEAKELYQKKISMLKKDLQELKRKGNADIQNLLSMIGDLFDSIADEQMKIADLKILL